MGCGEIPAELHHVNGDRTDNRIENLKGLTTTCHLRIHDPAAGPAEGATLARPGKGAHHQVNGPGPGQALSMAAIGHLGDRPALIDRAAEELAALF